MDASEVGKAVHLLAAINRLTIKAFDAKTKQNLAFLILNDTTQVVRYNRAVLWDMEGKKPKLIGISGQTDIHRNSPIVLQWKQIIESLDDLKKTQILQNTPSAESNRSSVVWLPIIYQDKLLLGLWLERWEGAAWAEDETIIINFLLQGYAAAWAKILPKFTLPIFKIRPSVAVSSVAIVLLLTLVKVPLRIVAPCEIVAKDPTIISAPLEGIIEGLHVDPGQTVEKGQLLFNYDKRVPLQELKVAEKQVEIAESELNRTNVLAYTDKKMLGDISILELRLKKELFDLELAKYRAGKLDVKAPKEGVVVMNNPDNWRGTPVKIGEKIMMLADPQMTKVRIWVPESDNIVIDFKKPIKVFLNTNPENSYKAQLNYISAYSIVNEKSLTSFIAEADWVEKNKNFKLGLKGSAVLYGDNVSLFYYIARRPWAFLRNWLGF